MANSFLQLLTIHLIPNTLSIYIYREIKTSEQGHRLKKTEKRGKAIQEVKFFFCHVFFNLYFQLTLK